MVIDTEKVDDSKELVSSTVDLAESSTPAIHPISPPHPIVETQSLEIQNQTVQSTNNEKEEDKLEDDDDDSEDGCPNFSIYSSESMNLAKTTDVQLLSASNQNSSDDVDNTQARNLDETAASVPSSALVANNTTTDETKEDYLDNTQSFTYNKSGNVHGGLYSDSEDETIVKIAKIPVPSEDKAEDTEVADICKTGLNSLK